MSERALFANQRETNLASTVALVEEVLAERGSGVTPHDDPGALRSWKLGADAHLSVINRSEFTHVRMQDVVMTLDDRVDRPALFAELLDHNAHLCGAAFATDGAHVLLVTERSTLDLDKSEVRDLIARVLNYADQHAPVLVSRFGGTSGAR